jgi:hypothetical protein
MLHHGSELNFLILIGVFPDILTSVSAIYSIRRHGAMVVNRNSTKMNKVNVLDVFNGHKKTVAFKPLFRSQK